MAAATRLAVRVAPGASRAADGRVRAVSGDSARDKILELAGITPDELERRLLAAGKDSA
jgi:uncharacterized protein YggU (UPF0235/DUF167 family)